MWRWTWNIILYYFIARELVFQISIFSAEFSYSRFCWVICSFEFLSVSTYLLRLWVVQSAVPFSHILDSNWDPHMWVLSIAIYGCNKVLDNTDIEFVNMYFTLILLYSMYSFAVYEVNANWPLASKYKYNTIIKSCLSWILA